MDCKMKISYLGHSISRGFFMVEMLAIVAISATLVAISLPIYTDYINEKRQDQAKQKLVEIMEKQNSFKMMNDPYTYTTDLSLLGYNTSTTGAVQSDRRDPLFEIVASNCTGGGSLASLFYCVKLRATPLQPGREDSIWELQSNESKLSEIAP